MPSRACGSDRRSKVLRIAARSGMNLIPILVCLLLSGAYGTIPVVTVDSENKAIVHRELFEADLQTFSGPSYFWVTLGSSRAGKSTLMNTFVRLAQQKSAPEHRSDTEIKPFGVCHALMPCTTGMSGYGVQRQSGGVDFFIDTPGGDMFEGSKAVTHVLAIGASMASTSIAFVDTELNDRTIGLVSRIAVSLLDPSYPTRRPAGSFRRSGPSLVIIVNKNDDAIRQEREDGGLMRVWEQLLSSYPLDAKFIYQAFTSVSVVALPYVSNETEAEDPDSEYSKRVSSLYQRLHDSAEPVSINPTARDTCTAGQACIAPSFSRLEGSAVSIAAEMESIVLDANSIEEDLGLFAFASGIARFFSAVLVMHTSDECRTQFESAAAKWATPVCDERCGGERGSCGMLDEWLAPARAAAQVCFAEATEEVRPRDDVFSELYVGGIEDKLFGAIAERVEAIRADWIAYNAIDLDKTVVETRRLQVAKRSDVQVSSRYGPRCILGAIGGSKYVDHADFVTYVDEAKTKQYKVCGALAWTSDWVRMREYEVEENRHQVNVC